MTTELVFDVFAGIGLILATISLIWQIKEYILKRQPAMKLYLEYSTFRYKKQHCVVVTPKIENIGGGNLHIKKARLYIDQGGIGGNKEIEFPNLWSWEKGCKDCNLSEWTRKDINNEYPKYPLQKVELSQRYTLCKDLPYFSRGVEYIVPGEISTETKVLIFPKDGFYRVTFIVIPENIDCSCKFITVPLVGKSKDDKTTWG